MSFQALLHEQPTEFVIVRKLEQRHCLAAPCFPCLRHLAEKALIELVRTFGEDAVADAEHEHLDFSLFSGAYPAPPGSDVELEWTKAPAYNREVPYEQEESRAKQRAAARRLRQLYTPVIPLGLAIYALTLGGGYWSGWACDCHYGPSAVGFAFPALAVLLQLWVMNNITILLSQTEVEGRPLLRLLQQLECLDNYRVLAVLSCVDTFSRFTRAQFVGYISHCHDSVGRPFTEAFSEYGYWKEFIDYIGISGLAHLSFITGPICIQFGYMLFLRGKLRRELHEADERLAGEDMEVMDSMDDLAALMNWAMLVPAGKVLEMAALPINLDGDEDVDRLWDGMKTKVYVYLARDMPDGIMQMNLQAAFFCLVYRQIALPVKLQLLLGIVLAGGPVAIDSIELILMNRRITFLAGALMLVLAVLFGGVRTVGAFLCESAVTGIFEQTFQCLPVGQVETGNWTSGMLPG